MTVRCGCGRTMTQDALRGKGAYRCGCGIHIVIAQPAGQEAARCAWKGCQFVPLRDYDVPLCRDHVRRLKLQLSVSRDAEYQAELFLRSSRGEEIGDEEDLQAAADIRRAKNAGVRLASDPLWAEREKQGPSRVYFMRHDRLIKIGYSMNPRKRALALAGAIILATEPGARTREAQLHAEFGHLRVRGEWFSPGPDLIAYINRLRKAVKAKPITADGEIPRLTT